MAKLNQLSASLLKSSVSHDLSEMIPVCWSGAKNIDIDIFIFIQ